MYIVRNKNHKLTEDTSAPDRLSALVEREPEQAPNHIKKELLVYKTVRSDRLVSTLFRPQLSNLDKTNSRQRR
jgi:hypothetical protein